MSMVNRLKLEMKKELDKENNSLDKEVVLKIRHTNWGIIGPNDWIDVIWKVYNDLTVDVQKTYNRAEHNIETISKNITKKDYNSILKNIKLSKENNIVVKACDGSAWEIIQYEKGQEVWKKDLGYIYGVKSLETIAKIVMKLYL